MSDPAFSRSSGANIFGKLTVDIGKVKVSEATGDGLQAKASAAGMSVLEYVRLILDINVHGLDAVLSLQEQRLRMVAGIGKE